MTNEHDHGRLGAAFIGHREGLRRAALAIVGSPERADDVLQDAYLKVHAASPLTAVAQPVGYCFRVVRNLALDHWRRAAFESELMTCEEEAEHVPSPQACPERQAISRQYLAIFDRALRELPAQARQVFELYHLGGLTQRDIGRQLGVSVGLVNAVIQKATQALLLKRCSLEER